MSKHNNQEPFLRKGRNGKFLPVAKRVRPWVWAVELVHGCNLSCWHCPARLIPKGEGPKFMSVETWEAMCEVITRMSPSRRMEIAQCGEPTLHPQLLNYLRTLKRVSPTTLVQLDTNGVTLQNGTYTFNQLFEAGANTVYVDMYAPFEKFKKLAEESGAEWYHYNRPGVGNAKRKANTYYNDPNMRLIVLQNCPRDRIRWRKMGRLSTFLNHIDWKKAMPYGLVPVREPYQRKCTFPIRFSTINWEGDYTFCCIDFLNEVGGLMGNVKDGPEAYPLFWFGRMMQSIRRRLAAADRAGIPYCSRCNCAFSKCDWTSIWPADAYDTYWDGKRWAAMPPLEQDDEVFADGWKKAKAVVIPTQEEEDACLRDSRKRVIHTREVAKQKSAHENTRR